MSIIDTWLIIYVQCTAAREKRARDNPRFKRDISFRPVIEYTIVVAGRSWLSTVPAIVYFGLRRSIKGLPACTTSFGLTETFSTTHLAIPSSALMAISNFIASRMLTTFSFSTLSPSLISTF